MDNNDKPTTATIAIDGIPAHDWVFEVHTDIQDHTISVAYGPIEDAMGSIKASLCYPGPKRDANQFEPLPRRIPFVELSIDDLVPQK